MATEAATTTTTEGVLKDATAEQKTGDLGSVAGGMKLSAEELAADMTRFGLDAASIDDNKSTSSTTDSTIEKGTKTAEDTSSSTTSKTEGEEEEDPAEELRTELLSLRQIAREQKKLLDSLAVQLEEQNRKLQEAQIITPEDLEKNKEAQLAAEQRQEILENILEVMRINPKYEDVDEVVSETHFADLVDAMTAVVVRQEQEAGKSVSASKVAAQIEAEIWGMKNPYKFCYEQIKQHHPDYQKKVEKTAGTEEGNKEGKDKPKGKTAEEQLGVEKTATSILAFGGGNATNEWTKERIDNLDEMELGKVPKDIYEKYMRNELK